MSNQVNNLDIRNITTYNNLINLLNNGEEFIESVFNRPLVQLSQNVGYLKGQVDYITQSGFEPAISKKSAFNKDFGSTAGTVVEGNDPRLSDKRVPIDHSHKMVDLNPDGIAEGSVLFVTGGSVVGNLFPGGFPSAINKVTGLQAALDNKASLAQLATKSNNGHTHTIAEILGLSQTLQAKSDVGHGHPISGITNLSTVLTSKMAIDSISREQYTGSSVTFVSSTSVRITLPDPGLVYQVTVNSKDLWDTDFAQTGTDLVVNARTFDKIIVYRNKSLIETAAHSVGPANPDSGLY
jgi:hypothetical protein